jgi:predicted dehydrogenase
MAVRSRAEAVMVGAGQRGHLVYGRWALAHPDRLAFSAVVEPDVARRDRFGDAHHIPPDRRFSDLAGLIASGGEPTAALVATPDLSHARDSVELLRAGFYVLVEKPMASSLEELRWFIRSVGDAIDRLQVVFELRYSPFYESMHEIVTSGRLGDVVTVTHSENLAPWFWGHSFVRGNWSRVAQAAPAIVAKCSHDLDLLAWNAASPVVRMASFGSLQHFRPERAPVGAPERCTDGCPVDDCLWDARRIYCAPDLPSWVTPVLTEDPSSDAISEALRSGPYGRCVYHAGADVVDHQVVSMQLSDGSTMTLQLNGHSYQSFESARLTRYDGTRASLRASLGPEPALEIQEHGGGSETVVMPERLDGHGDADDRIMEAFASHARSGEPMLTNARSAVEAHLLGFAAEEARMQRTVIDVRSLRASV